MPSIEEIKSAVSGMGNTPKRPTINENVIPTLFSNIPDFFIFSKIVDFSFSNIEI